MHAARFDRPKTGNSPHVASRDRCRMENTHLDTLSDPLFSGRDMPLIVVGSTQTINVSPVAEQGILSVSLLTNFQVDSTWSVAGL